MEPAPGGAAAVAVAPHAGGKLWPGNGGEVDDQHAALLGDDDAPAAAATATHDSWTAWWVLALYSYVSGLQSLLWMTFSSVPAASRAYLGVSDATLDLWLNFGPIAFCISVAGASWVLLARPDGLRVSILAGAGLCFAASLLRCAPLLLPDGSRAGNAAGLAGVYVGQFLNAAVAPLVVASPSYLSLVWFTEGRRNYATAVGNVANAVGRGVGFFLGPALVGGPGDIPRLLGVEAALAALPLLAAAVYLPALPRVPPSPASAGEVAKLHTMMSQAARNSKARRGGRRKGAAGEEEGEGGDAADDGSSNGATEALVATALEADPAAIAGGGGCLAGFRASLASAGADFAACLTVPGLLLLTLSGGLQMAVYGAWSGTLPSVLSPRFSDGQAGALGSVNTFSGVVGGLVAGLATDAPALRRRLKSVVLALCLSSAAAFGVLAAALGPAAAPSVASALSFPALVAICGLAGLLRGGADPLFFELSAELVHPLPAGTSGGVLTFIYHAALVVCLSLPPGVMSWSMVAMTVALVAAAALLAPVRVAYVRRA
jgi:hypothetical protein